MPNGNEKPLRKQYVAQKESTGDDNTAVAVISTDTVDRENEVLLPKGVKLDNYLKNPTVLWVHDYRGTPVGSAKNHWVKVGRRFIKAKWEWADTEKAQEIRKLWEGDFLNAVSVGFLPAENGSHPPTTEELKRHPEWASARRIYDDWELLEFSIVPVPANPEALAAAIRSKELSLSDELLEQLNVGEPLVYMGTATTDSIADNDDGGDSITINPIVVADAKPAPEPIKVVVHRHPKLRKRVTIKRHIDPDDIRRRTLKRTMAQIRGEVYLIE